MAQSRARPTFSLSFTAQKPAPGAALAKQSPGVFILIPYGSGYNGYMRSKNNLLLLKDIVIILFSILVATLFIKTGVIVDMLKDHGSSPIIASLVAGFFFTSVFTTAPAIVALGEIASHNNLWTTALFGTLGAVLGDLVIFYFIKDRFSAHIAAALQHNKFKLKLRSFFQWKYMYWFTFLVGGMIIASPLPDEVGISMLGFSKIKTRWFLLVSFIFNCIGIYIIGSVASALR
jgi:hypothetical protein